MILRGEINVVLQLTMIWKQGITAGHLLHDKKGVIVVGKDADGSRLADLNGCIRELRKGRLLCEKMSCHGMLFGPEGRPVETEAPGFVRRPAPFIAAAHTVFC